MILIDFFSMKLSRDYYSKINFIFLIVIFIIITITTKNMDNIFLCISIYFLCIGFFIVYIKKIKLFSLIYFLFFLYFLLFYKLQLDPFKNTNLFYVYDVRKTYTILKQGINLYYLNEGEGVFSIGEFINLEGDFNIVFTSGVFWEFDFNKYLLDLGVKNKITNYTFTVYEFKFLRYWFYQVALNGLDLPKMFIFQLKTGDEIYSNLINLNLSWILNISGLYLYPLDFMVEKYIFKNSKKYKRYKIILIFILLFYCYLLRFPIVLLKVVLLLFIRWFCYIKKINLQRITKFSIVWIIILFLNPYYLYNIGFIYSFLTLFLFKNINFTNWYKKIVIDFILIFLIFSPIEIYLDNKIYWFNQIFQIILMPFIYIFYFLSLIFVFFEFESVHLFLYNFLNTLVLFMEKINLVTLVGHISLFWMALYYICLLVLFKSYLFTKKRKIFILFSTIFCSTIMCFEHSFKNMINTVDMLNVGNGNTFVIKYNSNIFMYDIGSGIGHSKTLITSFLNYNGIYKINTIFISHDDSDHINMLDDVLKNKKVSTVINNDNQLTQMKFKNMTIHFFNDYNNNDNNDNSMVIIFEINKTKLLFVGDATIKREVKLLKDERFLSLTKNGVDFFQVGHHGSKTSSSDEFIKNIKPTTCFISGEKKGNLQFPNIETTETLLKYNCNIYTTDSKYSYRYNIKSKKTSAIKKEFF